MESPLHILHLEDDPSDAALVQSVLETAGITCAITCVQNREGFTAAVEYGVLTPLSFTSIEGTLFTS